MTKPRVAIIGAGSSGITAIKALADNNLDPHCFEASDRVGGNWVYHNKNNMSACYRDLHINTSKRRMQYADYPMPDNYPDYSGHELLAQYFDNYINHFDLGQYIHFNTRVEKAERNSLGLWTLTFDDGRQEDFDALIVANGHHWDPQWPDPPFPGSFSGLEMHAHSYDSADFLEGKNVVVVGLGNSASDIAVESSYLADNVYLSVRRGAYIVPKYIFGLPTDEWAAKASPRIPFKLRQKFFAQLIKLYCGDPTNFHLPQPDHQFGQAHPTISATLLERLSNGAITVKPNIARLDGDHVVFSDGSTVSADVIIYCTGYKISFPFFDQNFFAAPDNQVSLFYNVFSPTIDNLFFIGLVQPLGAVMPIAEQQSKWIADYLNGFYHLPEQHLMLRDISEKKQAMARRYVASRRHTIQVDFDDYLLDVREERRRGAIRALNQHFTKPLVTAPVG